ncbi:ParB/RepB/Spo0J family partition protein [Dactylosporangium sucinum]|nr:ParB/RepB/Spo0J family partition protein [Dactylosporangium sucinum]
MLIPQQSAARPDRPLRPDEARVTSSALILPLAWVVPGPNVRGTDVGDVSELAVSISKIGQREPILVAKLGERRYEIIEGHRRRKAAELAGRTHIDAVLRRRPSPCDRLVHQLAMHTHAKPFEPIAEARALHILMWEHRLTREEIAHRVGRPNGWVRDRLALLQLDESEQQAVDERALPLGEALGRVRERRAERDGRPAPSAAAPRPRREQHFTDGHPLAADARQRCRAAGRAHRDRLSLGGVACGSCWEDAIRADQGGAR